ncbi:sulfatase-like hydrolase/transferase [Edaphobacter acidisoli]|uniref:sulfatase-like hydrolase/transferase n=1 Tax=Edaphobacter acidisoli TaxID=2040573 RepID=UPI001E465391|nr:sulfatase-like hydrolase/transferase [Edaphobacter acidisoli]
MADSTNRNHPTRRDFLKGAALTSGMIATAASGAAAADLGVSDTAPPNKRRPNVLMICADQFRADFIGASHKNSSVKTPHIDALAERGMNFRQCISNQPLCSPSRASFLTSRYATEAGVWRLGLELDHSLPTIATEFRKNGYSANFIGKWHVSATDGRKNLGWIPPGPSRGGFDDLWEGANVLELVSHPYEGNYWDNDGKNIGFKDEYRVDFIANRAVQFIERQHDKPWLLFLSQLEPHHQNDVDEFVPPKRYEDKYIDPYIPTDLRNLLGNWRSRIPGYYGCVQAIDDCVGTLVETLQRTGQLDNTIILFFSDHGCTFRTRMGEYKRSPHEPSIHVPFVIAGPGFDRSCVIDEVVSLIDMMPTLLDGAGLTLPASLRGKSLKKLGESAQARKNWDSTAYFQISQSICGRGIRTRDWSYCVFDPAVKNGQAESSAHYQDFVLYSIADDPNESLNLVGRPEYREIADQLRQELASRIVAAGEAETTIEPIHYYA